MKEFNVDFSNNPSFETVTGLTNTTFNPDQIVEGRMATEAQIQELERRYTEVEARRNYCCRDIVVWKTYTRIVSPDGIVLSNFIDNVVVGTARRGMPFTVTFAPKWNGDLYYDYKSMPLRYGGTNTTPDTIPYTSNFYIGVNAYSSSVEGATQNERENLDYILINTTSTRVTNTASGGTNDVAAVLPGETTPASASFFSDTITLGCSTSEVDTCGPQRTFPVYTQVGGGDGGDYYIYRQDDGTITIDVKKRSIYRGTQDAFPNDPAYLMIFFTQFVMKERV